MDQQGGENKGKKKMLGMGSETLDTYGPYVAQLMVQIVYAVMNIVIKVALEDGLNHYVFVTYRQLVATLAISPVAYFAERYVEHESTMNSR